MSSSDVKKQLDPIQFLAGLDVEALRLRIEEIDRERKALIILIRSAARRATPTPVQSKRTGVQS